MAKQTQRVSTPLSIGPVTGQAVVAVSGTAVQLDAGALDNGVIVTALSGNANPVTLGAAGVTSTTNGTGDGYVLVAGASVSFALDNVNLLFLNGIAGDGVTWAGS